MAASKSAKKKRTKNQKRQNVANRDSAVNSSLSSPERSPSPISSGAMAAQQLSSKPLGNYADQSSFLEKLSVGESHVGAAESRDSGTEANANDSEKRSKTLSKQLLPAFLADFAAEKKSLSAEMVTTDPLDDLSLAERKKILQREFELDEHVKEEDLETEVLHSSQPVIPQRSVARSVEVENAVLQEATHQQMVFAKPIMLNDVVASENLASDDKTHSCDDDFDPDLYFSGSEDEIVSTSGQEHFRKNTLHDTRNVFNKAIDIERVAEPLVVQLGGLDIRNDDGESEVDHNSHELSESGTAMLGKESIARKEDEEFNFSPRRAGLDADQTCGEEETRRMHGMIRRVDEKFTSFPDSVSSPKNSIRIAASHQADSLPLEESTEHSPQHHTERTKSRDRMAGNPAGDSNIEPLPAPVASPSIAASQTASLSSPNASPRPYKYAQSPLPDIGSPRPEPPIFGVCVVGFHHKRGPEVEYWVGPEESESNMWPYLPFQSLPDGSHQFEENICYFTLLYDRKRSSSTSLTFSRDEEGHIQEGTSDFRNVTTLFAIACSKQMPVENLKHVSDEEDYTRSVVQKSIVMIASKPIFGSIKEKLTVVTRSYFSQRDFNDRSIIDHFYANLVQMPMWANENDLQVGMNLQRCIHDFGPQVLTILKAMLLERKIIFYSSDTDELGATQFALISLVPNLISNLEDCGSPLLSTYEMNLHLSKSFKSSDRASLLKYSGLPLQLFAAGGVFAPFVPLQQFEDLKQPETRYGLFGTANNLFLGGDIDFDMVVNVDRHDIQIRNAEIAPLLKLTDADRAFAKDMTAKVNNAWDTNDTWQPQVMGYYGGEDYIRHEYEEYLIGLLGCAKYVKSLLNSDASETNSAISSAKSLGLDEKEAASAMQPWGKAWVEKWMSSTNNFRIFDQHTEPDLYHSIGMIHPGQKLLKPSGIERFFGLFKSKPHPLLRQSKSEDETSNSSAPHTPSVETEGFDFKPPLTPHELLRIREEERSAERRIRSTPN